MNIFKNRKYSLNSKVCEKLIAETSVYSCLQQIIKRLQYGSHILTIYNEISHVFTNEFKFITHSFLNRNF